MLPEHGEGLCAICAALPLISGSPNKMLMGATDTDCHRCTLISGLTTGMCACMWVWLLCSSVVARFPQKPARASRSSGQALSRAEISNLGGRNLEGVLFRSRVFPWWLQR